MEVVIIKYLHLICLMGMFGFLLVVMTWLGSKLTARKMRYIARLHFIYTCFLVAAVLSGILLWLVVGEPAQVHFSNLFFHVKITVAILLFALAISTSVYFLGNRNAHVHQLVPNWVRVNLACQSALLLVIPLLVTLKQSGFGDF